MSYFAASFLGHVRDDLFDTSNASENFDLNGYSNGGLPDSLLG